jgi:hypothetical protein
LHEAEGYATTKNSFRSWINWTENGEMCPWGRGIEKMFPLHFVHYICPLSSCMNCEPSGLNLHVRNIARVCTALLTAHT